MTNIVEVEARKGDIMGINNIFKNLMFYCISCGRFTDIVIDNYTPYDIMCKDCRLVLNTFKEKNNDNEK